MTGSFRTVLACVAHPDDEILGCGGTLARHAGTGDHVIVCFVADGVTSRAGNTRQAEELNERRAASHEAARIIGAKSVHFLDFEDQKLDATPLLNVTQALERLTSDIRPDIVYTHNDTDLNTDHCIVARAVLTATRPMPGQPTVAVYGFETLSSTEWRFGAAERQFSPQRFVDIGAFMPAKMAALEAYRYEMRAFPHARSVDAVRALAAYRGATVGVAAAEAFSVYRQVVSVDCRL